MYEKAFAIARNSGRASSHLLIWANSRSWKTILSGRWPSFVKWNWSLEFGVPYRRPALIRVRLPPTPKSKNRCALRQT
jgi:hypothetical protein